MDQLAAAIARQNIPIAIPCEGELVLYRKERLHEAVAYAGRLRKKGVTAEVICIKGNKDRMDYEAYAKKHHREKITYLD